MPSAIQNLARQLLASEPARVGSPEDQVTQAVRACEKLRVPLTKLTGPAGISSLISRSLALAKRRVPSLDGLRVEADGSLTVPNLTPQAIATTEPALDGGVVLVAELLGLLITLIGEPLTLSLIREGWADVSITNLTLSTKDIS